MNERDGKRPFGIGRAALGDPRVPERFGEGTVMPGEFSSLWSNALLILVGVALLWLGSVVIARMRQEATTMIVEGKDADPLSPFLDAYRRGQMSEEEFRHIAGKLAPERAAAILSPRGEAAPRVAKAGESAIGTTEAPPTEPPLIPDA